MYSFEILDKLSSFLQLQEGDNFPNCCLYPSLSVGWGSAAHSIVLRRLTFTEIMKCAQFGFLFLNVLDLLFNYREL